MDEGNNMAIKAILMKDNLNKVAVVFDAWLRIHKISLQKSVAGKVHQFG